MRCFFLMLDLDKTAFARKRGEEKTLQILQWLSYFHYSTANILCDLLRIKNKSIFSRLAKSQIIRYVETDVLRQELIMMTSAGLALAREFTPEAARYSLNPHRISASLVRHNLSLQIYLLQNRDNIQKITPEKCLKFPNLLKVPDAFVIMNGSRVAVEIERNHKATSRVFIALYEHALGIGKYDYYDIVNYVFPNETLKNRYLVAFNTPAWPLYEYDQIKKRYVEKPDIWVRPPDIARRFNFIVAAMI